MRRLIILPDGFAELTMDDVIGTTKLAIATNYLTGSLSFSEVGNIERIVGIVEGSQSLLAKIWFSIKIEMIDAHPVFELIESDLDFENFRVRIQSRIHSKDGKTDEKSSKLVGEALSRCNSFDDLFKCLEQCLTLY